MVELPILIIIVALIVLTIRRGKAVKLESPFIIQRSGEYHITLAPQLSAAQTFIEQIAGQFINSHPPASDLPTQYFEVNDPKLFYKGGSFYLLAIALRGGVLYFQAINQQPLLRDADSHYKTLREYSEAVLQNHPHLGPEDEMEAERLRVAVDTIAGRLKIVVKVLQADV